MNIIKLINLLSYHNMSITSRNKFIREKNNLLRKIKYYACKLLFPISFINMFVSNEFVFNDIKSCNFSKMYTYLNEYNNLLAKARIQMIELEKIKNWGILFNSYTYHKIYTEYIISMVNIYSSLILMLIEKNTNDRNKVYNSDKLNCSMSMKQNMLLFIKIHKIENKYILIDDFHISPVSPLFIDSLFPSNGPTIRKIFSSIQHPLYECDQLRYSGSDVY